MASSDRDKWNSRYRERGPEAFGRRPNDWLHQHRGLLLVQPRGQVLDLACGNGRNALYLARLGFEVEAVDISEVAISWLEQEAEETGVNLWARVGDLTRMKFPPNRFQVILNFNFLERSLFPVIEEVLAPGGLLFFETFTRDQIQVVGSEIPPRYTLEHNELIRAFPGLRVIRYREGVFKEESTGKMRGVASLVARKPGGYAGWGSVKGG